MTADKGGEFLKRRRGESQAMLLCESTEGERSEGRGRQDDGEDGMFRRGGDLEGFQRVDRGGEGG